MKQIPTQSFIFLFVLQGQGGGRIQIVLHMDTICASGFSSSECGTGRRFRFVPRNVRETSLESVSSSHAMPDGNGCGKAHILFLLF